MEVVVEGGVCTWVARGRVAWSESFGSRRREGRVRRFEATIAALIVVLGRWASIAGWKSQGPNIL